MLGAAGALLCMTAGTALGVAARERRYARLRLLESELDALARLRLMLLEERLGMSRLLTDLAQGGEGGLFAARLLHCARTLQREPLTDLRDAYGEACRQHPAAYEQKPERLALVTLFGQLGTGTASMREQAVASCMRHLKPLLEQARAKAESGGKLCMQLGLLTGLMAGIALW